MRGEHWYDWFLGLALFFGLGVLAFQGIALVQSFWHMPEVRAEKAHTPSPLAQLDRLERGKLVFQAAGCLSCHLARLEPGGPLVGFPIGPTLSNAGMRRDERWLREHYINPHKLIPGSKMNSYAYLPSDELDALVAYVKSFTPTYEPAEEPKLVIPERFTQEQVERGKALFASQGCTGCHMIGKAGGVIGPNLTRAGAHGRTDQWQLQHLKDPLSVYVIGPTDGIPWPMPRYNNLSDEDLWALVAYLQSLR